MADARKPKWQRDPSAPPRDHYQELTDRVVSALEAGTVPWKRPWNPDKAAGPMAPMNPTTGRHYRGVNTFILGMDARAFLSSDPRWCSFNQAKDRGWNVRKGEKSTTIFFYKQIQVEDEAAKDGKRVVPVLRAYPVFHASQIDGIPAYVPPNLGDAPWQRPEAADAVLRNSGAVVRVGGGRAFYSPSTDHIQLPPDTAFASPELWSATALHELGHWTGHADRLNRDLRGRFGSGAYAQEELRAELASVFIGAELGLPSDIPHHASYVASWLDALKDDKREMFRAASDAQRMADYCLAFHPEWKAARAAEVDAAAVAVEEPEAKADAPGADAPALDAGAFGNALARAPVPRPAVALFDEERARQAASAPELVPASAFAEALERAPCLSPAFRY